MTATLDLKTYQVTFTVVCNGHPRKWVPDAIWENLNGGDGEDVLEYDYKEIAD